MNDPDWAAKNRRASYNMMPRVENWTAAFKLSQEEARDIAVTYVLNNYLTLEKPVAFGKDGAPSYPKVGERARLKLDNIGGVRFVPDSKAASGWTMTGAMDLRTAVLAVRLGMYLREQSKWGVSTIYWGGMGVGRDEDDRHGKGLAIDFHGALTNFGKFDVAVDWGQQPITLPNGKTAKTWPLNVMPYFRLDVDTPAGGFFYAVYHFLAGKRRTTARTTRVPSATAARSCAPTRPIPRLRMYHQDHIHCEVAAA